MTRLWAAVLIMTLTVSFTSCKNDKKEENTVEMDSTASDEAAAKEAEAQKAEMVRNEEEARKNSIAGLAMESRDLDTLVIALKAAGLDSMMLEKGEYTVFAPTNHAFSELKKKTLDGLLAPENKQMLTSTLQYHVVPGIVTSEILADSIKAGNGKFSTKTVNGEELTFMMSGDQIEIKDGTNSKAQIVQGNIKASNGIIHKVSKVLMDHK